MLSSWVAVAGLFIAVISLALARKQLRDGYEHRFVERFWVLEDKRLELRHAGPVSVSVERERYLRLCEDEYEAMSLGGVSFRTWDVWHRAIKSALEPESAARRNLEKLPDEDYELLRRCLSDKPPSSGRCPSLAKRQRLGGAVLDALTRRVAR